MCSCLNQHTWPVLAGASGTRHLMLSAPIILYDYPTIAPESSGDFFDATEIDELLALRVMTMTDQEKREAAGTDERAREIVARAGDEPTPDLARLHGAIRSFEEMLNPSDVLSPEQAVDSGWCDDCGLRFARSAGTAEARGFHGHVSHRPERRPSLPFIAIWRIGSMSR